MNQNLILIQISILISEFNIIFKNYSTFTDPEPRKQISDARNKANRSFVRIHDITIDLETFLLICLCLVKVIKVYIYSLVSSRGIYKKTSGSWKRIFYWGF